MKAGNFYEIQSSNKMAHFIGKYNGEDSIHFEVEVVYVFPDDKRTFTSYKFLTKSLQHEFNIRLLSGAETKIYQI